MRPPQQTHSPNPKTSSLPPNLRRLLIEAIKHHQAKQFLEAEKLYSQILTQAPFHAETLHLRGLVAFQQHQFTLALPYLMQAVAADSTKSHYHYNLGLTLEKENRLDEAIAAYQEAVSINRGYVEALQNLGNLYRRQRRWPEAMPVLHKALQLKPQSADIHNTLGVAYKEQGTLEKALEHYQHALALDPRHAEAMNNRGVVFQDQGKLTAAAEAFQHALTLKPQYANAHYHLGLIKLWQGQEQEALSCFHHSADLLSNHGHGVAPSSITKARIKHDYEQIQYIAKYVPNVDLNDDYLNTLKLVYNKSRQSSSNSLFEKLTSQEQHHLAPSFNRTLYIRPTPRLPLPAINPLLDVFAIETQYFSTRPEVMYVDDLLTEQALIQLRAFCLESTIWKRDYQNGYIGTFLAHGFACPLLLQIAEELRTRFPRIFQQHRLQQAWAFKYDSALWGLNMHADAAAVNVNFWITPDEANHNPESGGLVVWDKEAPDTWDFAEYNNEENAHKIQRYLEDTEAHPIIIPHRQNRGVIFNSNLFHKSDNIDFEDTYECRRINITLLYGHRQKS